uniref:Uncharacterized protein n=1 Tax=Meloidogyne hapla TaxID=6305 RepID=A0A1I8BNC5_MELHA
MSEPLQKSEQINSTVWLDKVPVESFINEKEVLEERRALLWSEEEKGEKLKEEESLIEEKPWWKTTKTEKEFLISEKSEKEKLEENGPELIEKIFVEDKDEGRKLNEEEERDEETDEQSSTHTVIQRPEVLIEEAVDITPLMDRAYSLQGEEVKKE